MSVTRLLDPVETRVLGALMEKEQATPDGYPLTVATLLAACNQQSNRDPVTEISEEEVWDALERLRQDVLVWRRESARAERWEHCLDRRWHLGAAAKAVMTLLMLRGPQTPGELRTRSERLHPFETVQEVEEVLAKLAGRDEPLVRELPRRSGQRGSRWAHCMGRPEQGTAVAEAPPAAAPEPAPGGTAGTEDKELAARLERLEGSVERLEAELRRLREALGEEE